jgi:hypothetical protein
MLCENGPVNSPVDLTLQADTAARVTQAHCADAGDRGCGPAGRTADGSPSPANSAATSVIRPLTPLPRVERRGDTAHTTVVRELAQPAPCSLGVGAQQHAGQGPSEKERAERDR